MMDAHDIHRALHRHGKQQMLLAALLGGLRRGETVYLAGTSEVEAHAMMDELRAALGPRMTMIQTELHAWPELHCFLPTQRAPVFFSEPIDTRPGRRRPLAFAVPGDVVPVRRGAGPWKGSRLTRSPRSRRGQRGSPVHP